MNEEIKKTHCYKRSKRPRTGEQAIVMFMLFCILFTFLPFMVNDKVAFFIIGIFAVTIIFLIIKGISNYKKLPIEIRREYWEGKIFPILEKTENLKELIIILNKKGNEKIRLSSDGVWFTKNALLSYHRKLPNHLFANPLSSEKDKTNDTEIYHIKWYYIKEWQVCTDNEGPDYYRLKLRENIDVDLYRSYDPLNEADILDFVRSTGQVPVRIFCDIN
ncbi:MAG: hypothetical protein WCJ33_09320 [Pseudomonadota bacterium]